LYEHNLARYFSDGEPFNWLTECFYWADQKEGRSFWEMLHKEWQEKLGKQMQK
jgi:frataxin-like iron-binding protein CyaY